MVTLSGGQLLASGTGKKNLVTVSRQSSVIRISDAAEPISTGSPSCTVDGDAVSCPVAQVTAIRVELRGGHDQASIEGELIATVLGGPGHDAMRGGSGAGTFVGGGGNDVLGGRGGNDEISGGAGADLIRGGSGDDELLGGGGNDVLQAGPGGDLLAGGGGIDQFSGGKDRARDRVNCGGAIDFAILFPRDRARGCEFVKR